jgi:predicted MFS family arabinose efflux permease
MLREPLRGGGSPVTQRSAPRRSVWRDVCYVLSIRTNIVLVVGCSFGYFFMAGLSTFGVALMRGQFHVGQSVATLLIVVLGVGALVGVLSTGRIADRLITRGHIGARTWVGGAAFLTAAMFILPALLTDNLALAIAFAFLAAIGLGGVNPPLNAARLDIVHSRLWGTAEAVRTTVVSISTGLAPIVFGLMSTSLGLQNTFLVLLGTLVVGAALILSVARRTYPRDVATAMACEAFSAPLPATPAGYPSACPT